MSNPQDNSGTPPPSSPSGSSTPFPPSTNPQPKKRRIKMLARKTTASGALSKKLNAQLKAAQAQDSDNSDNSFKSMSEGGGPGSSDFEKTQNPPSNVSSALAENLENRFVLVGTIKDVEMTELGRSGAICGVAHGTVEESGKKSGGSGSGEAAKDLKVGASYDPKKRRTPTSKAPSATKPSKKRKAFSPTTTETPLPKGRDPRSRVKQSESELQKALVESKKKRMDKGKGKVAESSEAVDVEEMEQVHQEEHTTMEFQTPKPKKTKTSSKKSSSVSKAAKPPLAKRTRSTVKSKQVRVSKDEEWSGEEESESDVEQDKLAKFVKRIFLKGRLLKDLVEPGMVRLVDALAIQGWKDMVFQMDGRLARNEIIKFMANADVKDGRVTSQVKGVQVTFDAEKLGGILDIPTEGCDDYTMQRWPSLDSLPTALEITRRFCDVEEVNEAKFVHKSEMKPQHKVLFEFVNKCLLPRQERRHIANYMDFVLMECLECGRQINWPAFIIKQLDRVINGSKAHATPYGFILTTVLDR
ncbi:uncharacterized protein [Nicotiana sylvestris]|uniref:uncharacterized protein n=1 Tax=Nicotiana sylvestris TaxID=4096 RepID=UPI00388CE176